MASEYSLGTCAYLSRLKNSYHDSVTQNILALAQAAEVENATYAQAIAALRTARQAEDDAYKRNSDKDFAGEDLKAADILQDKYMTAVRNMLAAYRYLPETEPLQRQAREMLQTFDDFDFDTSDGFEAEADKIQNMVQVWSLRQQELSQMALWIWIQKALEAAHEVKRLTAIRVENDKMRIRGEMIAARKATDSAVAQLFAVIDALNTLSPADVTRELAKSLLQIEQRAKQYYISSTANPQGDDSEPAADGETNAAAAE